MGSSHQGFYRDAQFFQDGGYKSRRIIKDRKTKKKKKIICVKLVIVLIFCNEKVHFIDFLSKI